MKRSRLICLLIGLVMLATVPSCSKKDLSIEPPWETGEKSVYEVKRDGTILATWEMRVEPDEAGIALVSEMKGTGFSEVARVKVDPRSLLPEAVSFAQETELTKAGYTATFTTDEAIVTVEPPPGSPSVPAVRIDIPEGLHFENESFLMVLRAMPLKKGFKATVTDVVTRAGKVYPVEVKVIREEAISTVAGQSQAYVVELAGFSQYVWVAKDAPHQIFRFENSAAGTICELVSYQAK